MLMFWLSKVAGQAAAKHTEVDTEDVLAWQADEAPQGGQHDLPK